MNKLEFIESLPTLHSDVLFDKNIDDNHFYIIETIYYDTIKRQLQNTTQEDWDTFQSIIPIKANWLICYKDITLKSLDFNHDKTYINYKNIISNVKNIVNDSVAKKSYINSIIDYYYQDSEDFFTIMDIIVDNNDKEDHKSSIILFDSLVNYMSEQLTV